MIKIRQIRKSRGWSVNQMADYLGVNERTVRRWEYGKIETPQAVMMLLACDDGGMNNAP